MKLVSWNVNGLRSVYKKGFPEFIEDEKADILCLQEIKVQPEQLSDEAKNPDNYSVIFNPAKRRGYSGVATYIRSDRELEPDAVEFGLGESRFDDEGRFLISRHPDFTLYNIYFPSGTTGDLRQDFKYDFLDFLFAHLQSLPKKERDRLIVCGDFNICHKDIDIHHPRTAEKRQLSGFLPEERKWMDTFSDLGFVDAFRAQHGPEKQLFTWWSFRANSRAKNLGWRIDYFFLGNTIAKRLQSAEIHTHVSGSDHCPISIELA